MRSMRALKIVLHPRAIIICLIMVGLQHWGTNTHRDQSSLQLRVISIAWSMYRIVSSHLREYMLNLSPICRLLVEHLRCDAGLPDASMMPIQSCASTSSYDRTYGLRALEFTCEQTYEFSCGIELRSRKSSSYLWLL